MSTQPPGSEPPNWPPPGGSSPSEPNPPGSTPPGQTPPGNYPPPGGYPPPGAPPPGGGPGGYPPPNWPPPGGYPPPGASSPPGGQSGYPSVVPGPLAEWPQRALGGLIDFVAPGVVVFVIGRLSPVLSALLSIASLAYAIYNAYLNGTTGQSIGHQVAGVKVVSEQTGQVIGAGQGILRWLCHIIDAVICYIGFLFPLWDAKKQTIADKIMKTVVLNVK